MTKIVISNCSVVYPYISPIDFNLKRYIINTSLRMETLKHKGIDALNDFSISLNSGDKLGVLGKNGAGKSTLLNILAGNLPLQSGTMLVEGSVLGLTNDPLSQLVPDASGIENIIQFLLVMDMRDLISENFIERVKSFSGLGERIFDPVVTYSTGMKVRLKMSMLLNLKPEILIMDEGFGFADKSFASESIGQTQSFFQDIHILVAASHNSDFLRKFCNMGLVLQEGKMAFLGGIEDAILFYQNC